MDVNMNVDQHGEIELYKVNQLDTIKQFVILSISNFDNGKTIVKTIKTLSEMLANGRLEEIIKEIEFISKKGLGNNCSGLMLVLVVCYRFSADAKKVVGETLLDICRIPTHLFLFLRILKQFEEFEKCEKFMTADFYKYVVQNLGKGPKDGRKINENDINDNNKIQVKDSNFIPKQKFVAKWFTEKQRSAEDLLQLLTKYPRRYGWDSKKICQYCHIKIDDADLEKKDKDLILTYHLKGIKVMKEKMGDKIKGVSLAESRIRGFIDALENLKKGTKENRIRELERFLRAFNDSEQPESQIVYSFQSSTTHEDPPRKKLSRLHITIEHFPTELFNDKSAWEILIKDIPQTTLLRNISHMAHLGLFNEEENDNVKILRENLTCPEKLLRNYIYPFDVLKAYLSYSNGSIQNYRKNKNWNILQSIRKILSDSYHITLKRNENIRFDDCMVCVDNSASMRNNGFLNFDRFTPMNIAISISSVMKLHGEKNQIYLGGERIDEVDNVLEMLDNLFASDGSDIPNNEDQDEIAQLSETIKNALINKSYVKAFIIFTIPSSDHILGSIPYDEFKKYQNEVNSRAKLVICSMGVHSYTIADTSDLNVLTVCGVRADILPTISSFIR